MKYFKQWTLTETLMSNLINLRKVFCPKYIIRTDYNCLYFWTNTEEPKLKAMLFVEPTMHPSQAAFDELAPTEDKVRRFRVAGSDGNIVEKFTGVL